jgi:hypothetical protein
MGPVKRNEKEILKQLVILGTLGLIYAIAGFFTGNLDPSHALAVIWASLSILGLRAGIENSIQKSIKVLADAQQQITQQ